MILGVTDGVIVLVGVIDGVGVTDTVGVLEGVGDGGVQFGP